MLRLVLLPQYLFDICYALYCHIRYYATSVANDTLLIMDLYIREIEKVVTENNVIVEVDTEHTSSIPSNILAIIPSLFERCDSKIELMGALFKRLRKSGAAYTSNQICAIAVCCLCSHGYSVSHLKMRNVTSKDMADVWGHLETMKVSSSEALSKWINNCMGSRSQTGYILHHRDAYESKRVGASSIIGRKMKRRKTKEKPVEISNMFIDLHFGSADTVKDAIMIDMKILAALKFLNNDPIPSFHPYDHLDRPV